MTINEKAKNNQKERRVGMDRRQWACKHDFPFVDSHGFLVVCNRRTNQDRRQSQQKISAAR